MKIFPTYWANPDAEFEVVETPVGEPCFDCEEPIEEGQIGVVLVHYEEGGTVKDKPWHRSCFLKSTGLSDLDRFDLSGDKNTPSGRCN